MRRKTHDIQWPVTAKTVEDINTNFDLIYDALTLFERAQAAAAASGHEMLSLTHSDTIVSGKVRGDILTVQSATPYWARLAKGTSGYVLTAGATDVAWASPAHNLLSATHTDTLTASVVRGDVIIGNATPKWSRLARGTSGYVLTAGALDVSWASPAHAILSATHDDSTPAAAVRGDIITAQTATPKWARLALTVPAATYMNYLGVANAELEASWKGLFDATVPTTIAEGAAAATGSAIVAARRDHTHGAPATWAATAHAILSTTHSDTLADTVVRGDVLVGNATPKWARLAAGTATYILTMGATDPEWAAPVVQTSALLSAVHTDTTEAAVVRGDLIAGIGATPKWERLAAGTATHVLTMGADEPGWAEIPTQTSKLLSTTHTDTLADDVVRGDLIVGNATPKWARLAKGTSGYVLTMGADDPAWTDLTAAIAHNLLSATHPDTLAHPAVRGDLIVGDSSTPCLWAPLSTGGAGTVLKSDGTDPFWGTVAWAELSLVGSSLADLATRSSGELSDAANLAYLDAMNIFVASQYITVAGPASLWIKATTNNVVQLALQRDEGGGSYNVTWNAYIPASSTDFRIQGGGTDWLTITAAGLATFAGTLQVPTIYGSSAANGDITIEGTSHATKTTSYVILQPTGGNVGIRVATPVEALDVGGGIAISVATAYVATTTIGTIRKQTVHGLVIKGTTGSTNDFVLATTGGNLLLANPTGTDNIILNAAIGNTGIGTTTPSAKLSINGGLHVGGDSDPGDDCLHVDSAVGIGTAPVPATRSLYVYRSGAKTTADYAVVATNVATSSTDALTKAALVATSTGTWDGASSANVGLYISTVSGGTTNYAIYDGSRQPSYFSGNVLAGRGLHVGGSSDPGDNNLLVDGTLDIVGATRLRTLGAFAAGDKYVIADASGNLHLSALGPAS